MQRKIQKNYKYNEYAVYKGEKILAIGTIWQIASELNVAEGTVWHWTSLINKSRNKGKRKIAILLDDEEE